MVGFKQVYTLLPTELCEKVCSYYNKRIKCDFKKVLVELRQKTKGKSMWMDPSDRLINLCRCPGMFQFSYIIRQVRIRYGSPRVLCEPMFDTHLCDNFSHMIFVNWNLCDEHIDIRIVSEYDDFVLGHERTFRYILKNDMLN